MSGEITELALEAYNMWANGITDVKSIAFELERSEQWVRENLKKQGVTFEIGRKGVFDEFAEADKNDIVARYTRGEPVTDICVLYHVSAGTLYNLLKKMGIPPRQKARDHLEGRMIQNEIALRMYKEGWVIWHICDETGLHPPDVLKVAREAGCPPRGRGHKGRTPMKDDDGNLVLNETGEKVEQTEKPKKPRMFDDIEEDDDEQPVDA